MQPITFKSIQILPDGGIFFCDNSSVKYQTIIFVEKDSRNREFNRKKELRHKLKSKHFFMGKSKYLIY
jgi:hypothetical protein